jgi:cytosolic 5'-nucleotidase 3
MDRNLIALTNPLADSFIPNPDVFSAKVAEISKAGIGNVEVISDFDFTMTRYKVNDVKGCSTYTLLQNSVVKGNNAGSVQALIDFYHPIEIDPSIPTHIKQQHMQEWWEKSNKLILDDGFHKNELRSFVYASPMYFRHGVQELINTCRAQNVPITILSGGIGNLIEVSLSEIVNIDKIKIFSNFIEFDDQGRSLKFLEPEIRADKSKILNGISNRKNLILLGDLTSVCYI